MPLYHEHACFILYATPQYRYSSFTSMTLDKAHLCSLFQKGLMLTSGKPILVVHGRYWLFSAGCFHYTIVQ